MIHIALAVGMAITAVLSWAAIALRSGARARFFLDVLLWGFAGEVITGSLLALYSPSASVQHFCMNIGLYIVLTTLASIPSFLFLKKTFPWSQVVFPIAPSLGIAVMTASLLMAYA